MKRAIVIVGLIVAAVLLSFYSYFAGHRDGRMEARTDFYGNAAGASLMSAKSAEAQPQLREYAKAQFYYYTYMAFQGYYEDLGPVDEKLLIGLEPFIRHADSPNDYYKKP